MIVYFYGSMIVYVLMCSQNKYYIGSTNNLEKRLKKHDAEWTRKYKPIRIVEIIENADNFDEDKYTKIYMDRFGIENVRGGSYCQINLSENQVSNILSEIKTTNNLCYECGHQGHYIEGCNGAKKSNKKKEIVICTSCNKIGHYANRCRVNIKEVVCYKCNKNGHYANRCRSKKSM